MNGLDELRAQIAPLLKKIDALSRRERLLVMVTLLALIAAVWQVVLMEPLGRRADASRIELTSLRERITTANENLEEQILQLASRGGEQRTRIADLERRIEEINATLGNYAAELIDPAEMAHVLENILEQQANLSLVRIRNVAPQRLSASEDESGVIFYRHGLEIELEGSYAACLDYLGEIESLPWRLYWQLLDLEVVEYPRNRIRLEVSTLSLDEEWIGA